MAANQAPDWEWWKHVPTVTLREAVALSLDLDPARSLELRGSSERREFEKRLALATRCYGESLEGLNRVAVGYGVAAPTVKLQAFAKWAMGIGLEIPGVLSELAGGTGRPSAAADLARQHLPDNGFGNFAGPRAHARTRAGGTQKIPQLRSGDRGRGEPPVGGQSNPTGEIAIEFPGDIWFENRDVPPFIVGDEHTVFEWCLIYVDQHPAGLHNYKAASFRDMQDRLTLLGATGGGQRDAYGQPMGVRNDPEWQITNEVYRELERDIDRDWIIPLRRTYCDDAPSEFDPTRCLIDIEPVLALARRRGDFGQTMGELLAVHDGNLEVECESAGDDALTHSGFPGRPGKGKHLIDDEFDRRVAAGEALPSLADEAKALLDWLKEHHPKVARPTPKTIEENIRARHRQWKGTPTPA
jgi:hypothetical protein